MPDPTITTNPLPGADGRAAYLDDMGRAALRAEADLLDARVLELQGQLDAAAGNGQAALQQALDDQRAELEASHAAELQELRSELEATGAEAVAAVRAELEDSHAAALADQATKAAAESADTLQELQQARTELEQAGADQAELQAQVEHWHGHTKAVDEILDAREIPAEADGARIHTEARLQLLLGELDAQLAGLPEIEARHTEALAALGARLDGERVAALEALQGELDDQVDAAVTEATKGLTDTKGLIPIVLHVRGVEWNGTQVRLVRCGVRGELGGAWMVQLGGKLLTRHGHRIPVQPYRRITRSLQDKVRFTLDEALDALRNNTVQG